MPWLCPAYLVSRFSSNINFYLSQSPSYTVRQEACPLLAINKLPSLLCVMDDLVCLKVLTATCLTELWLGHVANMPGDKACLSNDNSASCVSDHAPTSTNCLVPLNASSSPLVELACHWMDVLMGIKSLRNNTESGLGGI